jgi:hypothetical protein
MKKKIIFNLLVLLGVVFAANANILVNPGFEDGTGAVADNWVNNGTAQRVNISEPGYGDYMMQIGDVEASNPARWHWAHQIVDFGSDIGGTEFYASASYKTKIDGDEYVSILIRFMDASDTQLGQAHDAFYYTTDPDYLTYAWRTRDMTAIAPSGTTKLEYRAFGMMGGGVDGDWGQILIDNATLTIVPEPASLAVLGLGALFLRKKKLS